MKKGKRRKDKESENEAKKMLCRHFQLFRGQERIMRVTSTTDFCCTSSPSLLSPTWVKCVCVSVCECVLSLSIWLNYLILLASIKRNFDLWKEKNLTLKRKENNIIFNLNLVCFSRDQFLSIKPHYWRNKYEQARPHFLHRSDGVNLTNTILPNVFALAYNICHEICHQVTPT